MKNLAILFIAIGLFSCTTDDDENENWITEEGTIYYDENSVDNCELTFQNKKNAFYGIQQIDDEFKENQIKVWITYKITEDRMNCGFGTYLNSINIKSISKLSNN